jgi:hypothetical protein
VDYMARRDEREATPSTGHRGTEAEKPPPSVAQAEPLGGTGTAWATARTLQKVYFIPDFLDPVFMRVYNLHNLCSKVAYAGGRNGGIWLCPGQLAGAGPVGTG